MSNSSVTEIKQNVFVREHVNFCWKDSLPIQHLLDSISSILAEEYIMIAKQNPAVFTEIDSSRRIVGAHNDEMGVKK